MKKTVFDCQMCGQCCEGEGGIVLSPKDLKRLYEGLNLEKQASVQHDPQYQGMSCTYNRQSRSTHND